MIKLMQIYKPFLIEKLQNHLNTKETSMGKPLELQGVHKIFRQF